eukprot:COSAG02_NODE_1066_length_14828_cov_8.021794_2_plen_383_part_00
MFRRRPASSSIDHVTAWIPRTTPEPLHLMPTPPPTAAPPSTASVPLVYVFEEQASKRSPTEQSAIDWAEHLQQSIDEEEQRQAEQRQAEQEAAAAASKEDRPAEDQKLEESGKEDKQPRNQKGKDSPRRLTRQMTMARELSTDEKNAKTKTLADVDQDGVTAWVGGLPYELAVDKTALHDLLSAHGGDLKAITVRLKPPAEAGGTNKSWCFATFRNEDAIQRLQHAAATAEQSELKPCYHLEVNPPSSPHEHDEEALTPMVAVGDVEYTFERKSPPHSPSSGGSPNAEQPSSPPTAAGLSLEASWPASIIVKKADVERTLFTRKLEAIFAGRLNGMKMDRGLLSKSNTSVGHMAQVHLSSTNGQPAKKLERSPLPRSRRVES